jgi:hypothetical protein
MAVTPRFCQCRIVSHATCRASSCSVTCRAPMGWLSADCGTCAYRQQPRQPGETSAGRPNLGRAADRHGSGLCAPDRRREWPALGAIVRRLTNGASDFTDCNSASPDIFSAAWTQSPAAREGAQGKRTARRATRSAATTCTLRRPASVGVGRASTIGMPPGELRTASGGTRSCAARGTGSGRQQIIPPDTEYRLTRPPQAPIS